MELKEIKKQFNNHILELGIKKNDNLVMHSNIISFGILNKKIPKIFIDSLIEQIGREKLLSGLSAYKAVMVGASGALYGVLVAFAFLFPNARLMLLFPPIPIKAKVLVPLLILGDLFFGFTSYSVGPIAHFAHVGGAVTGLIMMWYWKKTQFDQNRWN